MSRNVYLVISDLHASYKNKINRHDYVKEIEDVINKIIKIANRYKQQGNNVILLFLGDIVDDSYKDLTKAIWLNNIFVYLSSSYKIYSVMGNHEFSYYKDNPFWSLMSDVNSTKIKDVLTVTWQPTGLLQLIDVRDRLEDGEVMFNFNHHPTQINIPTPNKVNIGLFHKDYAPKAVVEDMKRNFKMDVWDGHIYNFENSTLLDGYDYAFFGHLHKVYGTWTFVNDKTDAKTTLYYLASLGRPNHTEVQDNFLERNIPAIIVDNGKFVNIEDNKIKLMSREECVKEEVVKKQQEIYQTKKQDKTMIKYKPLSDDPITNVQSVLSERPDLLFKFNNYLDNDVTIVENQLRLKVEVITKNN